MGVLRRYSWKSTRERDKGSGQDKAKGLPRGNDLETENLYLREELDRLRLSISGAFPASKMIESLRRVDDVGDTADEAVAMFAQTLSLHAEMLNLVRLMGSSLADFEDRLEQMGIKVDESTDTEKGGEVAKIEEVAVVTTEFMPEARESGAKVIELRPPELELDALLTEGGDLISMEEIEELFATDFSWALDTAAPTLPIDSRER